ncbi:response regulator [Chryseobacterium sp. Leaf394]|uniref:response regulator transcription factor n=1 Tax=Chryseobacterium sp. Leaf394 TaxID=1736361 RepID=UPI0006F70175|nr:response regulator [Chryseobacterium sp. Leaf394]KQS91818.1 hypothetical protein ASG21_04990 [Chryseobacterium sp. Leaf394]
MRKIYLVEDDEAIREILEILLSSENYSVLSFANVLDFRRRDLTQTPDLYLFDVMLPDGSGIDLCEQIKNNSESRDTPVIIMSAHAQISNIYKSCAPDDFISKPFDIDNLLSRIGQIMH